MGGADFRQMQELEEERMALLVVVLDRVARGLSNAHDARELARELGLSPYIKEEPWQKSER